MRCNEAKEVGKDERGGLDWVEAGVMGGNATRRRKEAWGRLAKLEAGSSCGGGGGLGGEDLPCLLHALQRPARTQKPGSADLPNKQAMDQLQHCN